MTVGDVIKSCKDETNITLVKIVKLYGQEYQVVVTTADKKYLIQHAYEKRIDYNEIEIEEVKEISTYTAMSSGLVIVF